MPQFTDTMGDISPGVIGLTISMIMFAAAVPSILAGPPGDKYGRIFVIGAGAALFGIGGVLQASAMSLPQFIAGRVLAGVGQGIFLGLVNV